MFDVRHVLAATDGSEHGMQAVVTGAACARRAGAKLDVVSVVDSLFTPPGIDELTFQDALVKGLKERVVSQMRRAAATDAPFHLRRGLAAPTITEVASEIDADLIVVGAHPRPAVARFLVGSTAERVIRLSHRPVLVATEEHEEPFRRVLAAIDLSAQSRLVLEAAVATALNCGSELRALYVQDRLTPMLLEAALFDERETRHHAGEQLRKALAAVATPSELMIGREVREGHAGQEILHTAEEWEADLILMGAHGFGFFNRLLLGSISTYVLRHGQRAILIVPRPLEAEG